MKKHRVQSESTTKGPTSNGGGGFAFFPPLFFPPHLQCKLFILTSDFCPNSAVEMSPALLALSTRSQNNQHHRVLPLSFFFFLFFSCSLSQQDADVSNLCTIIATFLLSRDATPSQRFFNDCSPRKSTFFGAGRKCVFSSLLFFSPLLLHSSGIVDKAGN